jgi:hypothetical protein
VLVPGSDGGVTRSRTVLAGLAGGVTRVVPGGFAGGLARNRVLLGGFRVAIFSGFFSGAGSFGLTLIGSIRRAGPDSGRQDSE